MLPLSRALQERRSKGLANDKFLTPAFIILSHEILSFLYKCFYFFYLTAIYRFFIQNTDSHWNWKVQFLNRTSKGFFYSWGISVGKEVGQKGSEATGCGLETHKWFIYFFTFLSKTVSKMYLKLCKFASSVEIFRWWVFHWKTYLLVWGFHNIGFPPSKTWNPIKIISILSHIIARIFELHFLLSFFPLVCQVKFLFIRIRYHNFKKSGMFPETMVIISSSLWL